MTDVRFYAREPIVRSLLRRSLLTGFSVNVRKRKENGLRNFLKLNGCLKSSI